MITADMGGICGIVSLSDSFDASERTAGAMCEAMAHRGPDGQDVGSWSTSHGRATLGHRRLSIIETPIAGHNPMSNEDGSVWMICDGMIYNHAELRDELETRGHRYRSHTDTETILHLYEDEGRRCVERLDGIFAIAIWDTRSEELFLARDHLGVKPLYYANPPGGFLFGSEIKVLLEHGAIRLDLDEDAFHHYLTFIFTPAPLTMFAGVRKLAPAERMTLHANGTVRSDTYWTPLSRRAVEPASGSSEAELEERLLALLRSSVRKSTMADVPQGVFLSGGVDSSTIVALMSELTSDPVRTYSIAYEEHEHYNELEYAREIANRYGTDHHVVEIAEADLVEFLPRMVFQQDEPIADWACVPLHYLSQFARDHGTIIAHVGEGSDELFHGHSLYTQAVRNEVLLWNPLRRFPGPLRRATANAATHLTRRVGRGEAYALDVADVAAGRQPFWGSIGFRGELKSRVLAHGGAQVPDSYEIVQAFSETAKRDLPNADLLQRITYLELKQRVPELLLMRLDKMTMATSVEARVPFLDRELVEFVISLPPQMKVRGRTGKWLLKKAVAGTLLPKLSVYRRKQGFDAPVAEWFRGDLGYATQRQIRNSGLAERGLIDYEAVDGLWAAHRRGPVNWSAHLWLLYNVSAWYDRWIAGLALA
jgi:asparagine synthase (glutamine-hydrolysing)